MTPMEVLERISIEMGEDGTEPLMPRGTEVEWYALATPEQLASEEAAVRKHQQRMYEWDRETYLRLKAKFEGEE